MIEKIIRRTKSYFSMPSEEDILRALNSVQWIDHAPGTVARDLGCSRRRAFEALKAAAAKGYARHISFKEDGAQWDSFHITKEGLDQIGAPYEPNPGALPEWKFLHIFGDPRLSC